MQTFDYMDPDYTDIFIDRQQHLDKIRSDPEYLQAIKIHYKTNPLDFINDWGFTFDPRQIEKGKLPNIPFILWPRQSEYLEWVGERWKAGEYGIVEKSRDCGVTWLTVAYFCTNWLFVPGFSGGFASAKEDKVDRKGDPDCIFEKVRYFISMIPEEFMPVGYEERVHSGFMKMINPENGATITGEAGDQIGRGGRKSIIAIDEAAFVDRQQAVDNAVSQATNCHIDISTYNGNGNLFYRKAVKWEGTRRKFVFDWSHDPRKDQVWYAKQKEEKDPITVAQEIDRDPNASAADTFIPSLWIQAAVDLHKLIKKPPTGIRVTAFDPADIGDAKALVSRHGYVINAASLKNDADITQAIPWAYEGAFRHRSDVLAYDADGMGTPVMKLTFETYSGGTLPVIPFYGSGEIVDPEKRYGQVEGEKEDRNLMKNKDKFMNFRAQAATWLRDKFEASYEMRQQIERGGVVLNYSCEKIISIDSTCENYFELVAELSRPRRIFTNNGKIRVESKKEMKARNVESPNLFDAAMMVNAITEVPRKLNNTTKHKTRTRSMKGKGWC